MIIKKKSFFLLISFKTDFVQAWINYWNELMKNKTWKSLSIGKISKVIP